MSDTCFFHFLEFCSETYWDCGCLRYKDRIGSCRLPSLFSLWRKSFPYKWKYLLFSSIFFPSANMAAYCRIVLSILSWTKRLLACLAIYVPIKKSVSFYAGELGTFRWEFISSSAITSWQQLLFIPSQPACPLLSRSKWTTHFTKHCTNTQIVFLYTIPTGFIGLQRYSGMQRDFSSTTWLEDALQAVQLSRIVQDKVNLRGLQNHKEVL